MLKMLKTPHMYYLVRKINQKQKLWSKVVFWLRQRLVPKCIRESFSEGVPAAGIPRYLILLCAAMFIVISQSKMKAILCVQILHQQIPVRSTHPKEERLLYAVMTTYCWDTRTENPSFPELFLVPQRLMELQQHCKAQSNVNDQNYLTCLLRNSLAPGFP